MSMSPRRGRPASAGGALNFDGLNYEQIAQRALDFSRAAVPYLPIAGPASQMASDLRDGNYRGALVNGVLLAADLTPMGPARRVLKVMDAINDMRRRSVPMLARAGTQTARIRKVEARIRKIEKLGKDYEVHHTIPMAGNKLIAGKGRDVVGLYRNHPANLKVMDKVTHRRLTGNWTDPATGKVLKQFNAPLRAWHGTNALQKTTGLAVGATAADSAENLLRAEKRR